MTDQYNQGGGIILETAAVRDNTSLDEPALMDAGRKLRRRW
ncbi:hypothetical protein [Herminiimonas sp. CN]|nr:hypothetical protein [Herminiimonas sp. CN]